jgi:hypothetical protein
MDNGWNPGYYDKWENFHPYEKKWYCTINKIIHQSEKEKNNCKHCIEYENIHKRKRNS